jgi:hypothetical protein
MEVVIKVQPNFYESKRRTIKILKTAMEPHLRARFRQFSPHFPALQADKTRAFLLLPFG